MKLTHSRILLLFFTTTLFSCATIFNNKKTNLVVNTYTPTKLIVNNDTINELSKRKTIAVDRKNERLTLQAFTDTTSKLVYVAPINSVAYSLNALLYPVYLMVVPAVIIDGKKDIRYGYPKHIYLDVENNDGQYFTELTVPIKEKNALTISVFSLVDVVNQALDFTYERKLTNQFTVQGRFGKLLSTNMFDDVSIVDLKGYRVGLEARYFLKRNAPKGAYFGVEINRLSSHYRSEALFTTNLNYNKEEEDYYLDNFRIEKRTLNFNLKYGYQFMHKGLVFDIYGGLGVKDKLLEHFDRQNIEDIEVSPRHPNVYHITNKRGHYIGVNLIFNFRLGYSF